jgi:DNA-directed RNA polymerase subunit M/transcription elongation factor TFIIS
MEIDRVEEWRRLTDQYSAMSDDELEAVANDGWELTDVAQQTLQSEISSRGLKIQLKAAPPPSQPPEPSEAADDFDPADLDLVVAQRAWDLSAARQTKDTLDAAGIPSYLGPDNLVSVGQLTLDSAGGVDIKVRDVDHQHALQALAKSAPSGTQAEEPDYVARCPKCHSSEIVFQSLDAEPGPGTPSGSKFNWSCDACGYTWKDDGIEQEA